MAEGWDGVVEEGDGAVLVGVGEFRGEEVHQSRTDAVGIVLFGLREELLVICDKVEQLVFLDGAAKRAAKLLLMEGAEASTVGKAGSEPGPLFILVQRAVNMVSARFLD